MLVIHCTNAVCSTAYIRFVIITLCDGCLEALSTCYGPVQYNMYAKHTENLYYKKERRKPSGVVLMNRSYSFVGCHTTIYI